MKSHRTHTPFNMNQLKSYSTTIIILFSTIFMLHIDFNAADPIMQCDEVKQAYVGMGFSSLDVPDSSIITRDVELEICPAGFSCCTRDMEIQLTSHSATTYDDRLLNATASAKKKLTEATTRLHTFFTQQIAKAERDTDELFTRAYDKQYVQNKAVFDQLFTNFKNYYSGDELDVGDAIHQFFRDVFVTMFNLQNPVYNFTDSYLTCVGEKMDSIGPFGAYPERLYRGLRQALVASRTFIQGLAVGRNVALKTQNIQPTISCSKAHMKMNFCSHCRGLPSLKPCANYCLNVMKGCLAYHSELDRSWQRYIDAMDALALRVSGDGSFNLESVLKPLKDQLSMAVMEYHLNSEDILRKVLDSKTGCGAPPNSPTERVKRATPRFEGTIPLRSRSNDDLKVFIEGVKITLRDVKYLWSHNTLAGTMCSAISATTGERCWNGENEATYRMPLVGDGVQANKDNPEVEVDITRANPIIVEQVNQLHEMTARIINATIGVASVAWINLQIPLPNVTGLSSESRSVKSDNSFIQAPNAYRLQAILSAGSGSGVFPDDDEDNDRIVYGSGDRAFFNRIPLKPTETIPSGSGNSISTNDDEENVVTVKSTGNNNGQPRVGIEVTATPPKYVAETAKPAPTLKRIVTTTLSTKSSSNVNYSTISILLLTFVLAYL